MNITPDHITSLAPNEIFVYGANGRGLHGAGAAKQALQWGAVMGQVGFAGQTYGICTKDESLRILSLDDIFDEVEMFTEFAESRPDLTFLVTRVGCGYARYEPSDIAPMFRLAAQLDNVYLPASFWEVLND